ncbi:MAG: NAD(P)H-hydrate dehydratase [Polyangiales bacterium]
MQPLFTREESRDVDRVAVEDLGVVSLVLMENAGRGAMDAIVSHFADQLGRVVLVGGPGQNGGDAWVIARRLAVLGHSCTAVLIGDAGRLAGDAATNWGLLEALDVDLRVLSPDRAGTLEAILADATLVVDGLFGTGLDRPITGGYAEAVRAIDGALAPLVSLDLPSGLDADTGGILGVAPHAALTVTFAGLKRGLHQYPGAEHAGEVRVADIGIPSRPATDATLYEASDLSSLVPRRTGDAHKGTNGHLLVIGGAPGTTGAALLAGRAAFRAGAGLVTIGARPDARAALEEKVVELMTVGLPDTPTKGAVESLCGGKRAVVLGPGLGLDPVGRAWTDAVAAYAPIPVVIDADAITNLATDLSVLRRAAGPRILTPHPGEAARLLDVATTAVQRDRYAAATAIAGESGQTVILKGARSIVASGNTLYVCGEGTPALGVAGTGDVLSGVTGTLCMTLETPEAAIAATLVHALAGDAASVGDRGILASEVADAVPGVLARFVRA